MSCYKTEHNIHDVDDIWISPYIILKSSLRMIESKEEKNLKQQEYFWFGLFHIKVFLAFLKCLVSSFLST